jgi:hypothetical protein
LRRADKKQPERPWGVHRQSRNKETARRFRRAVLESHPSLGRETTFRQDSEWETKDPRADVDNSVGGTSRKPVWVDFIRPAGVGQTFAENGRFLPFFAKKKPGIEAYPGLGLRIRD